MNNYQSKLVKQTIEPCKESSKIITNKFGVAVVIFWSGTGKFKANSIS